MTIPLLVGCPVYRRGWSLWDWFLNVEAASERIKIEPTYIFAVDPRDHESIDVIEQAVERLDRDVHVTWIEEPLDMPPDLRVWNADRYHRMVYLRNELLRIVRDLKPMLFLSLDSDIFIHDESLEHMIEGLDRFAAIGGKCYMTPDGTGFPSWMNFNSHGIERYDHDSGPVEVDVVMAMVLMQPAAYNIDYRWSSQGEDIGWSEACREAGLKLGWDGRITNKHVMIPSLAQAVDVRVGY